MDPKHSRRLLKRVSPWHQIPCRAAPNVIWPDQTVPIDQKEELFYHFVNEIPRGSSLKLEVATHEPLNPIAPDLTSDGKTRYLLHGPMPFNYGCIPQTFENPKQLQADTGYPGDGDPLDVVDISPDSAREGQLYPIRVLGSLALIDQNECDFKIIATHARDERFLGENALTLDSPELKDTVDEIITWFRDYKTSEGKPQNKYAWEGKIQDVPTTHNIIGHGYFQWEKFISGFPDQVETHSLTEYWTPKHPIPPKLWNIGGDSIDTIEKQEPKSESTPLTEEDASSK